MKIRKVKSTNFLLPSSLLLVISGYAFTFPIDNRRNHKSNGVGKSIPVYKQPPSSYSQICRRIDKLDIDINSGIDDDDDNKYIIIAIDSTGIKITNRGQWMDEKWNVQNRKRGYLKIHVAVNIKTKEILTLEVTDEKVHDSTMLRKLINHVLDISDKKIESVLADGAHDTNRNFRYLEKKGITPGIKVRKNSIISARNNRLRNREVRLQTKDLLKWKTKRKYGNRWIAETSFSTIKRMFGSVYLLLGFKLVKEMMIKVSLYNLFRRI
jgi:hypothetical protein